MRNTPFGLASLVRVGIEVGRGREGKFRLIYNTSTIHTNEEQARIRPENELCRLKVKLDV